MTVLPIIAICLFSVLLCGGLTLLCGRNVLKAALAVSAGLLLLFSYQTVRDGVIWPLWDYTPTIGSFKLGPNKFLFTVYAVVFAGLVFFLFRARKHFEPLTKAANVMAGSLVVFSLLNIGMYQIRTGGRHIYSAKEDYTSETVAGIAAGSKLPDIYYIIPDGYARNDVLKEFYGYDNSEFINYLQSKGFYIGHRSVSNYMQTCVSLPSSLNMNYLPALVENLDSASADRLAMMRLITHNHMLRFLKKLGYTTVVFESILPFVQEKFADIYMVPGWSFNQFQNALIDMTPIPKLLGFFTPGDFFYRNWVSYPLDHLADPSKIDGPVFVFAHILCPHPPFLFAADGSRSDNPFRDPEDGVEAIQKYGSEAYISGYVEQLKFTNSKLKDRIEDLLSDPNNLPIIIIQSDHGPGMMTDPSSFEKTNHKERHGILNAYFFPDRDYSGLYPTITPVNTFRVVSNKFFGTNYDLLPDRSYYSTGNQPYKFVEYIPAEEN